ncbi:hypothetical protein F1559_001937 [Cyanidiococcus yangmingshanensis]|uniref:Adaptor protein ClpS core domain-containing protein n=1 Tax=Cyanidiococcus yangmingshanensis TaxID=2690220 RepID=A0A7J7IJQ4_9RHOD|nr:hypothetical protein F1559_001937 [Cyanidiococcus yangmingshanensis]
MAVRVSFIASLEHVWFNVQQSREQRLASGKERRASGSRRAVRPITLSLTSRHAPVLDGGGDLRSAPRAVRARPWREPSSPSPGGGAAVLERAVVREKTTATKGVDPGKKYKLLLFNDQVNTRERVVNVLLKCIPGLSKTDAHSIMQKAHTAGKALVGIWVFELAEAYCDLLRSEGLVSDIEPAE